MHEARRRGYLHALGIDLWVRRDAAGALPAPDMHGGVTAPVAADDAAARATPAGGQPLADSAPLDWDALQRTVAECRRCTLCDGRTQTVFGTGDRHADWLIVGEAPGAEEDRQGEPFVGAAGKLLNRMLQAVGLERGQVYIANTLKCRPPGNRDPREDELAACRPYLDRQVALLRPRLVLAVGRIAAQALLASDRPLGKLRGRVLELPGTGIPLVATYHPAYLLRTPSQKRLAWHDLLLARRVASGMQGGGGES
jgi:DNA polymerase